MNLNFKNMQKVILCLLIATGAMATGLERDQDHPFSPGVKYKPTLVTSIPTSPSKMSLSKSTNPQDPLRSSPATARGSGAPVPRPCSPLNLSQSKDVSDLTLLTITPPPSEPPTARGAPPSAIPTPEGGSGAATSRLSPRGTGLPPRAPVTGSTGFFLYPPPASSPSASNLTGSSQPLSSLQKSVDEALMRRHLLEVLEKSNKELNDMKLKLEQLKTQNAALTKAVSDVKAESAQVRNNLDRHVLDPHTHLIEPRHGQLTQRIELLEDHIKEIEAQTAKCHCTIL